MNSVLTMVIGLDHTLQAWTSTVRLERIRYHPELTGESFKI